MSDNARDRAEKAKALGNTAFKEGNYPSAIGHYTTAIIADPKDKTFPLNRAAAYLKLGKYQDAERDCTTVLKLDVANVKALFRRAQARISLESFDNARADLNKALKLEPGNQAVKTELETVEASIQKRSSKAPRVPLDVKAPESKPRRRRVPIKIVDPPQPAQKPTPAPRTDLLTPVSSRPIQTPPATTTPPSTFQEAKEARSAKVGGGIFRASGSHTVFKPRETPPPAPAPIAPTPEPVATPTTNPASSSVPNTTPITLFSFTKKWESLTTDEARWTFLNSTLSPETLPAFFQTSLDPALLTSFLSTFLSTLKSRTAASPQIKQFMIYLSRVARFKSTLMFMSNDEKAVVAEIWSILLAQSNDDAELDATNKRIWGITT